MNNLDLHVKDNVYVGAYDASDSLGIVKMPNGYALMQTQDGAHFYWIDSFGRESCICWDKWSVYRGAKRDSIANGKQE